MKTKVEIAFRNGLEGSLRKGVKISDPKEYPDRWGIGGGDIGAILGLNQYRSPHDVWLKMTGRLADEESKEALEVGLELESWILRRYSLQSGIEFTPTADLCIRDTNQPWRRAHADGVNVEEKLIADAKVVGIRQVKYWGEPGSDQVPDYIYLQQLWYLGLLDWKASHLAAFRWDDRYRITGYVVGRSPALEARMLEKAEQFWTENVLKDIPPAVTATETTIDYIREAYPREHEQLRVASEEETQLALALRSATVSRDQWEQRVADAQVKLQALIGTAEGISGDWGKITWKATKDTMGTDWERVARELAAEMDDGAEALESYVRKSQKVTRKGSRRFTPRFEEE